MCAYDLFSLHSSRLRYEFIRNKSDKYIYGIYIMIAYSIIDKKKEGGEMEKEMDRDGRTKNDQIENAKGRQKSGCQD